VTCTDFRESISAHLDGEPSAIDLAVLHRHLAGCADCQAFETEALRVRAIAARVPAADRAPTTAALLAAAGPVRVLRRRDEDALRLGLVFVAVAELIASVFLFLRERGYNGEDHAGHESLSFTLAVCVGLLYVAARPRQAGAYLPLLGVAVALLTTTAVIDVRSGRAELVEELPHVNLLVGFVLLWLIAHGRRPPRTDPVGRLAPPVARKASAGRLRLIRVGIALAGAFAAVAVGAAPASAHAVLEGSTPAPDALLPRLPAVVTLAYDEPVTTLPTSLQVFGPDGSRVDDGVAGHPGGVGQEVSVRLRPTTLHGTYLVSWRVISADSHPVSGAFTFSVRDRTAAPKEVAAHTDRFVAFGLGASRFLGYLGCALLVGGLAFLALCWRAGASSGGVRRVLVAGATISVVGATAALFLKGPYDAALGLGSLDQGALLRETLRTTYGTAVLVRLGVCLGALALLLGVRGRVRWSGLALAATALVATFPFTGHADAGDQRPLAVVSDLVHVTSMSTWLGGLFVLVAVVLRGGSADAVAIAGRFSRVALTCIAVLIGTGTYQAWRQVRAWGALTATTYGRELLVKIGLVAVVVVVAWFSRAWVRRAGSAGPAALARTVALEVAIALGVVGLTSALVATEPASAAYHPTVAANLALGPDIVQVSAVPDGDRSMDLHLYVFGKDLRPVDPPEVTAELSLTSQGIGPLPLTLQHVDVGHEVGHVAVPVTGDWTLAVRVRTDAFDEYSRTLALPIH
jgi:copper transport protein